MAEEKKCWKCKGKGKIKCNVCEGKGAYITQSYALPGIDKYPIEELTECPLCEGRTEVECPICHGTGETLD